MRGYTSKASEAFILNQQARAECGPVEAWVKNNHLGFEILYQWKGAAHSNRPDFLVRLKIGETLILETKGLEREQDRAKRAYAEEWVEAVDAAGSHGNGDW